MRTIRFVAVFAAALPLLFASCTEEGSYKISGKGLEDGTRVELLDLAEKTVVDSATVSGGKFTMKGVATPGALMSISEAGAQRGAWQFQLFNDGTPVSVDFADSTLSGSAANVKLAAFEKNRVKTFAGLLAEQGRILSMPKEDQKPLMDEFRSKVEAFGQSIDQFIEDNKDGMLPAAYVSQMSDEDLAAAEEAGAAYISHPYVAAQRKIRAERAALRAEADAKKQAFIGQQFTDLEEADVNGRMHKLSEYVGKGKWVLVDFWASWCGPCQAEMPNVVAAYKAYNKKGFDIVGLSFDRDHDSWAAAIKDWDMPWHHLSDLKYWQSLAASTYGVNSIPDNLLIDPKGKIVARGLRGEDLAKKLSEVIK